MSAALPIDFSKMSSLEKYLDRGVRRNLVKGQYLFFCDETANLFYYIKKGRMTISYVSENGEEFYYCTCEEGGAVNTINSRLSCLLVGLIDKDVEIYTFRLDELIAIVKEDEQVMVEMMNFTMAKEDYFVEQAVDRVSLDAMERISKLLCDLAEESSIRINGGYMLNFKLTQKYISQVLGMHFITVCRVMKELTDEGLIKKEKGFLVISSVQDMRKKIAENVK